MANIRLVTTGGTIASRYDPVKKTVLASVSGEDLRRTLHDPLDGVDFTVDEFCNLGSSAIDLTLAHGLTRRP